MSCLPSACSLHAAKVAWRQLSWTHCKGFLLCALPCLIFTSSLYWYTKAAVFLLLVFRTPNNFILTSPSVLTAASLAVCWLVPNCPSLLTLCLSPTGQTRCGAGSLVFSTALYSGSPFPPEACCSLPFLPHKPSNWFFLSETIKPQLSLTQSCKLPQHSE